MNEYMQIHKIFSYGWKRDLPDIRDHIWQLPDNIALPPSVDLRPHCPPVYDQGQLGSCTANAIVGALQFDQMRQQEQPVMLSRLFVYFNERKKEGNIYSDSGASIRDGIKSVYQQGACPESEWPYDITQFQIQPPPQCYTDAILHRSLKYQRVHQDLTHLKACLASGYVVVFGFSVYSSFESAQVASTGIVPMPQPSESQLGGHAVCTVGYDDAEQRFLVRNSWGTSWGQQGYFTMPYDYLTHTGLASDFWQIRTVE